MDADDIRVAEDFDESLLHRTPEIDSFLTPGRDDKFIAIGIKGFGKTLLDAALIADDRRAGRSGVTTSMASKVSGVTPRIGCIPIAVPPANTSIFTWARSVTASTTVAKICNPFSTGSCTD